MHRTHPRANREIVAHLSSTRSIRNELSALRARTQLRQLAVLATIRNSSIVWTRGRIPCPTCAFTLIEAVDIVMSSPSSSSRSARRSWLPQRAVTRVFAITTAICGMAVVSCRDSRVTAPLAPRPLLNVHASGAGRIPNGGTHADSMQAMSAARTRTLGRPAASVRRLSKSLTPTSPPTCGIASFTLPFGVAILPGQFPTASDTFDLLAVSFLAEQPDCETNVTVSPASTPMLLHNSNPDPGLLQEQPLQITFDSAVGSVSVYSEGAMTCAGSDLGTIVALDSAGHELARAAMSVRDSTDCGADSVSYGAYGTVAVAANLIRGVTILASPYVFPVYIPPDSTGTDTVTGHLSVTYELYLGAPVAGVDSVTIRSVRGPNDSGSFTSARGENVLSLSATAAGLGAKPQIIWSFVRNPIGQAKVRPPSQVTAGLVSSDTVPVQDSTRYLPLTHPAPLSQLQLSFIVTASTAPPQTAVHSAPDTITQSGRDALREEYVEYGIDTVQNAAWYTQKYPAIRTATGPITALNYGDHSWAVVDPNLSLRLKDLQDRWGTSLTLISAFRDPMHHRLHIRVAGGGRPVPMSEHQYGSAADIFVNNDSTTWARLRALAGKLDASVCIEPYPQTKKSHLHVHYDVECHSGWEFTP